MFKEVADIKTRDQLHLPVPEAKFETVVVKPSDIQKEMVQNLSERAAKVHSGTVDASEDNMLCITNDGRKIGLDQRLMNPLLPDDPASKLNACVRNVLRAKGFVQDENGGVKLNATADGLTANAIPKGQEVLIVIGEGLEKERIEVRLKG